MLITYGGIQTVNEVPLEVAVKPSGVDQKHRGVGYFRGAESITQDQSLSWGGVGGEHCVQEKGMGRVPQGTC